MWWLQVLNTQRDRIYSERRKALLADNLTDVMVEYSEETMNDILEVWQSTSLQSCAARLARTDMQPSAPVLSCSSAHLCARLV